MYPAKPGLIIGFHGCDLSVRNKLVGGKDRLRPSVNPYDWLGNGIYFWENNQKRAMTFAREIQLRKDKASQIRTPSAVGVVLDMGFCLDLLDESYIQHVQESHETLLEICQALDLPIPINSKIGQSPDLLLRNLDCAVIEYLHLKRRVYRIKPFDSVRSAFVEGTPLYENAGFHTKNHIQICVRNPNCIKGYFLPLEADNDWPIP